MKTKTTIKILGTILICILSITSISGHFLEKNLNSTTKSFQRSSSNQIRSGYIDISVEEVWDMCSSITNGITIPIDVRTDTEWLSERINTPYPEFPRHYVLSSLQTESGLEAFMNEYNGKDVIMYCKAGGRSASAAQILIANNFNGTIYNMVGGITAWMAADLPTHNGNTPPNQPVQPSGPTICSINLPYTFQTTGIDPNADVIRYGWDWNEDTIIDTWTEYFPSGEPTELEHLFTTPGQFNISVTSEDIVGEKSIPSLALHILATTPPSNPIINGPTNGKINEELTFTISSTDADNDEVFYSIEWDDGNYSSWLGPYPQATQIDISHTWTEKRTYTMQVKTKDINGIESGWTSYEISMPKIISVDPKLFHDIFVFGPDVDIKIVQLEPGEDYVDLEVLDKPFYLWANELIIINPGAFLRLYEAKGVFIPSFPLCLGMCSNYGIIG
jgi:rhodanese-related sulfurtransferase